LVDRLWAWHGDFLVSLSANFLGDALRDFTDPHSGHGV
jgi:hypothetical protein